MWIKGVKFWSYVCLIIFQIGLCSAILTGNDQFINDITSIPKYGCQWTGGTYVTVNCTCREDAEEFYIKRGEVPVYDTWTMIINNCQKVIFGESSIEDLRNLRDLHLTNIPSLMFHPESLNWLGYHSTYQSDYDAEEENTPTLKINIENSRIDKISKHTFKGRIKEIQINNCHIEEVESFAFSSLQQTETIAIRNTKIETLKPQSFKLFKTKQLILNNLTTDILPSRAFSNLIVNENFVIESSNFGTIYSGAFIIDGPKWFEVKNTKIVNLDGESFIVTVKGDVNFKNNKITTANSGAFIKITPNKNLITNSALYLVLESNFFNSLGRNSLQVQNLNLKIVDLKLNETCNCDGLLIRLEQFKNFYSEFKCLDDEKKFITFKTFKNENCNILSGHTTIIVIISVICILIIIMVILLCLYYHKTYREGQYGKNEPVKNMSLIVPDGRTYRETEVHVILERVDLLTTDL